MVLAVCVGVLLSCQRAPHSGLRVYRGLQPVLPEAVQAGRSGTLFLNVPAAYTAVVYLSPADGGLVSEWPGGTPLVGLGSRFDDGHAGWQLVRDPSGNEGWVAELFLDERLSVEESPADDEYLGPVHWDGEIIFCANPAGGPPGLDGDGFVGLVERVAARWQEVGEGLLPLVSRARCEHDPAVRGDGMSTIGWVEDLGLAIAGQAWPDAALGVVGEIDVRISRGYFQRLQARNPSKTLERCVFSTLVHEMGHVLGLDHPRSRSLPSSMQGFGAARCDKGRPSAWDRQNLLRRYAPSSLDRTPRGTAQFGTT